MPRKKVLTLMGTRPEAIKLAPVINELRSHKKKIEHVVVTTAQHRSMLDQVLSLFKIKPDLDLNIMKDNQDVFWLTETLIARLKNIFNQIKPDLVLVQGDTTTAFISTLLSYYSKVAIGHIEAGLRTFDKYNPYPEEINRKLISSLADFHFAPTERAKKNLLKEGVDSKKIFVTGNTIVDSLKFISKRINRFDNVNLKKINFNKKILVVTAHRRESFGQPLRNICLALKELAENFNNISIVYPVHPNPNVKKTVYSTLSRIENIHLIEPLDYLNFILLLKKSYLILSDSGGVQEEAASLKKPVLILRDKTERPEVVEVGIGRVVGTDRDEIYHRASLLINNKSILKNISKSQNPFGNGTAAKKIAKVILNYL